MRRNNCNKNSDFTANQFLLQAYIQEMCIMYHLPVWSLRQVIYESLIQIKGWFLLRIDSGSVEKKELSTASPVIVS